MRVGGRGIGGGGPFRFRSFPAAAPGAETNFLAPNRCVPCVCGRSFPHPPDTPPAVGGRGENLLVVVHLRQPPPFFVTVVSRMCHVLGQGPAVSCSSSRLKHHSQLKE